MLPGVAAGRVCDGHMCDGGYLSWSRPMVRAALKAFFPLPMVEDPEEIQSSGRLSVWYLFSTC